MIDPSGLRISTTTGYDSVGNIISQQQPASNGSDAGTTDTAYYSSSAATPCTSTIWSGLVCETTPATAITGGGSNPTGRASTLYTYNLYGSTVTTVETANSVTRTTTFTYDSAGRKGKEAVTGSIGQAVEAITFGYDSATGLPTAQTNTDSAVTTTGYDVLGRTISYSDGAGNTTTTQYDALNQATQVTDAKSTTTYTRDTTVDPRGVVTGETDSNVGTISAAYDADGTPTNLTLPGSVTLTLTTDPAGQTTSKVYSDSSGNVLVSDQGAYSIAGQEAARNLSTSSGLGVADAYVYDAAGRLSTVDEKITSGQSQYCTLRAYTYDADSNRTGSIAATGSTTIDGSSPTCPTTGTQVTHGYDTADRLVDSGYGYDAFGRTTAEASGTTTSYSRTTSHTSR